jgi:transglutaminase-like putative cysteine protease
MKFWKQIAFHLFLIFQVTVGLGQKKNFSVSPTEPVWIEKIITSDKKPALKDITDGYYLFLYEQQNNLETQEQYEHYIRDIVSDNGVQNGSQISVTYDPTYQKLTFHKIIVWRNNKAINKLNAEAFKIIQNESELSKFIYSGTYNAYLILDDIRKGDRIEYTYTLKGHNPVFSNKFSTTFYFQWNSQIANIYQNIIAKKERQFQIKNFNTVPRVKTTEKNGLKIYEWQDVLTKTIKTEDYEPSWYNPFARIQISEFKNWKEIVDWALQLNQYDLSNAKTLKSKVSELKTNSKGNKETYINLATRFVQDEIRYMGIEMGEYSHRPNSPEKVLKQRYGDCKDKSLLLISLLRANGIDAYSVYINTYLLEKTKEVLPAANLFNHEVSVVEFNGKKIWIDATITDQGGSILQNYFPYTANVLVIKPGNQNLELVKANANGKIFSESTFNLADTTSGNKTSLTIKSIYNGNYAEYLRGAISSSGINSLSKNYLDYYTKQYPRAKSTNDIEIDDDRAKNIISMTEHYEIEDIWEKSDSITNTLSAFFYSDLVNNELRPLQKSRMIPFQLKYPSNIHQIIRVITPEKWTIDNEDTEIKRDAYNYSSSVKYNGDTLLLTYNYENLKEVLTPEETERYVKDKATINRDINYSISFNKTDTQNADGINLWAVLVAIITLCVGIYGAIYIYKQKSEFDVEEIRNALQINGWLIIVAIGVVITPFIQFIAVFKFGHFNNESWVNISAYDFTSATLIRLLLFTEIIFNTLMIVYSILIAFLFFNRRKSLPKHYIISRILNVVVPIVDIIMVYSVYAYAKVDLNTLGINLTSEFLGILRSLILSAIWITYFLKSSRVRETFVFTYPKKDWQNAVIETTLKENFTTLETTIEDKTSIVVDVVTPKNNDEDI